MSEGLAQGPYVDNKLRGFQLVGKNSTNSLLQLLIAVVHARSLLTLYLFIEGLGITDDYNFLRRFG